MNFPNAAGKDTVSPYRHGDQGIIFQWKFWAEERKRIFYYVYVSLSVKNGSWRVSLFISQEGETSVN